jgi:hypothetical protein
MCTISNHSGTIIILSSSYLTAISVTPNELCSQYVDETDNISSHYENDYIDHTKIAERSFDKSITAIRIAVNLKLSMGWNMIGSRNIDTAHEYVTFTDFFFKR